MFCVIPALFSLKFADILANVNFNFFNIIVIVFYFNLIPGYKVVTLHYFILHMVKKKTWKLSAKERKLSFSGVVLVHVILSHDSRSNDTQFMHKLCKHGYFI